MIVVIQCAAGKQPDAGHLRTPDGKRVLFVARPKEAPPEPGIVHAHPDDRCADTGRSWREELRRYNEAGGNPDRLLPAGGLYRHPVYAELLKHCGPERLFILSAGWGLVAAQYLLPAYDITFSPSAPRYKRRRAGEHWDDLSMLPNGVREPIVLLVGKDYQRLACALTAGARTRRVLYHRAAVPPKAPGCEVRRFHTTARTNWHYGCARALMAGRLAP